MSVLACNLLMAAYEEDENWPEIFVKVRIYSNLKSFFTSPKHFSHASTLKSNLSYFQVYIEDSLGERIWVDSSHCKIFVDNIQTAFGTKMPPKSMLLQADTGRTAGDLSAGTFWPGRLFLIFFIRVNVGRLRKRVLIEYFIYRKQPSPINPR